MSPAVSLHEDRRGAITILTFAPPTAEAKPGLLRGAGGTRRRPRLASPGGT